MATEREHFKQAVESIYREHGYDEAIRFLVFKGYDSEGADSYLRENNIHILILGDEEGTLTDTLSAPVVEENGEEPAPVENKRGIFERLFGKK